MRINRRRLFAERRVNDFTAEARQNIHDVVESMNKDSLLQTSVDDLVEHFAASKLFVTEDRRSASLG